jgi:D-lactate dehydrogenase
LKSGHLGSLALDVYEEEGDIFFRDLSDRVLHDDTLARLLTFPNVLVTSHQAFFTHEAVEAIAATTIRNVAGFVRDGVGGVPPENLVRLASHVQEGGG